MENLIQHLKELGFNSYESKVYLSLLKHHPATGYEVSKGSGVPQARAYDTLKVLENRKIVVASGEKPVTYVPISPNELLKRCEKDFQSSVDYLKENLPNLSDDFIEPILNIKSTDTIIKHLTDVIDNAKKEIFIEIWNEDFKKIEKPLKKAHERGVDIKIVGYNDLKFDCGLIYQHGIGDEIQESLGGRWVVLVADNEEGIVGTLHECGKTPQAIWTKNPAVILIMKELVIHDMFLLDVESKLHDTLIQAYGNNMSSLREKILTNNFRFNTKK